MRTKQTLPREPMDVGKRINLALALAKPPMVVESNLIHAFVGGSELHGAKVKDTDDTDVYGVYIEPPQYVLGLAELPHFVWSSSGNDKRNTASDVDVTLYSLRKWARLACKGNPTALHFLFTTNQSGRLYNQWDQTIAGEVDKFLAKQHAYAYKGFAAAQLERIQGIRGRGKKGQRPELEKKYGYDVKAGMHVLRLLYEGIELFETGRVSLPRPAKELKEVLVPVRMGAWSMDRVIAQANLLFLVFDKAVASSRLPEKVDQDYITSLLVTAYQEHWEETEQEPPTMYERDTESEDEFLDEDEGEDVIDFDPEELSEE